MEICGGLATDDCRSISHRAPIHAEAIPGNNQFWISRPYRWKSLITAKLLFIIPFVNAPIFLARLATIFAAKLPIFASLPGLFWSQFLMVFAVCLPMAALAAITAGLVPFVFSALVLFAAGLALGTEASYESKNHAV